MRITLADQDGWDSRLVGLDGVFVGLLAMSQDHECGPDADDVTDREQREYNASYSHASGLRGSGSNVAMG
jgi:hypothetical protein